MRRASLFLVPLALMVSLSAEAGETGNLRGIVKSESGKTLEGATVEISGVGIAGERELTTSSNGRFSFMNLPPGSHELRIIAGGHAPTLIEVTVRLDETVTVPISLSESVQEEFIVVEETMPVIDATRSAISTEMTEVELQNLPVGRSYQSAVRMLPGVSGRVDTIQGGPSTGNPSVRGEGQYGNNYLVDGISTRDPATKTFGTNLNFDAIQSIQVYTDGAPAEFAQATGMMVNVATKDGGDEHHGTVGYWLNTPASGGTYDILDLETGEEEATDKRSFLNHEISLTAGGPIIKEKLWYFAAASLQLSDIEFEGMDPDFPYKRRDIGGFGKLSWFPNSDLTFQYTLSAQLTNIDNYETSGLWATEAQNKYKSDDIGHIGTALWRPDAMTELELKFSYLPMNIDVVPASGKDKADLPSIFNVDTGEYFNNWSDFDYNKRSRLGASLKATRLVEGFLGDHRFKAGAEYWVLKDSRQLDFTGLDQTDPDAYDQYEGMQLFYQEGSGNPCPDDRYTDCVGYETYQNVGELGHQGNILGFFLQDDWSPVPEFTANIGVRIDREVLIQNAGDKVLDTWMPAPRLGVAWDVTGDSKTLISLNAGRYFDLHGNSFADWADTKSANVYRQYAYDPDHIDPITGEPDVDELGYWMTWEQDPATDPLIYCTPDSLEYWEHHLVDDYGYTQEDADGVMEALNDKYCTSYLKPYHLDKVVLGFEREIIDNLAVGVRGIYSRTMNMPEDIDYDLESWPIYNPGKLKRRDYKALELTVEKQFDGRWQAMGSWTISESKGHMPGQFELSSGGSSGSNGNNVGVYMDDIDDPDLRAFYYDVGAGWLPDGLAGLGTTRDDAGYYGLLPYHSTHRVKLSGFYAFDFGTTIGLVYEFDSGRAWQKRGYVPLYDEFYAFPEGRGSRTMPSVHYIDFRVAHRLDFPKDRSIELTIDLFNLPDLQAPITYYENDNASFGKTMYRQAPRALRAGLKATY